MQDDRLFLRVRHEQNVLARRLRVEIDPCLAREPDALDERAVLVPDQENERPTRFRVVELHIDLAGWSDEEHLDADRGKGVQH